MTILFPYLARWKAINWTRYQRILTRMAEAGHTVHVLQPPATQSRETNFEEIKVSLPEGIHLHDVDIHPFFWDHHFPMSKLFKKGYYSLVCIGRVKKMIKTHRIDVLLVYNLSHYPLMKLSGCRKVFDFADDYVNMLHYELGMFSNPLVLNLARSLLKRMVVRSDLTTVISHALAAQIAVSEKVVVIPNGVDLTTFQPGVGKTFTGRFKKPVVGFIGSFEYFIDFDLILASAAALPDLTFLMVGSGRDFVPVKQRALEQGLRNIIFTGGVPFTEVPAYIDAMDICLNIFKNMPVSHGASPIKLFEYLAMKKPVISTRLKEVEYTDRHYLYYADSTTELTQCIRDILAHPGEALERISRGFDFIRQYHTWPIIVDQFTAAIEGRKLV